MLIFVCGILSTSLPNTAPIIYAAVRARIMSANAALKLLAFRMKQYIMPISDECLLGYKYAKGLRGIF